jgi:flagellar biosynthesis protein FlhB
LLVVAGLLQFGSDAFLETSKQFLFVSLESVVGEAPAGSNRLAEDSVSFLGQSAGYFVLKLWPVWILPLVAAAMMMLQIGPFFQPHLSSPNLSRLANGGVSTLWSGEAWLRLLSGTAKLLILSSIAWVWMRRSLSLKLESELSSAYQHGTAQAAGFLGALALGLIAWGAIDFLIQWIRLERKLKMSPEEQRQEQQEFEPDPRMRQEMASLAARSRPEQTLARSVNDLFLTDGMTRCIVLRFDPARDQFPRIVERKDNQAGAQLLIQAMRLSMRIHRDTSLVSELFPQSRTSLILSPENESRLAQLFAENQRIEEYAQNSQPGDPVESHRHPS